MKSFQFKSLLLLAALIISCLLYTSPMKGAEEGPSTETSQSTCPLEGAIIGSALARFSFLISSSEYLSLIHICTMNKLIQKSTSRAFMYPLVCFLFLIKRNVIAKSMDHLLPMQEKEKKNKMFVSQGVPML